ncbi:MAG: phosphate--acyl-ACP acyltransferase, partial [Chloroflexota bacterium]
MATTASTGASERAFAVAVDVMGGDYAPEELVAGAVQAARQHGIEVLLVGDTAAVKAELSKHPTDGLPVTLVPSQGVILETDQPTLAMREKPRASVVETAKLVRTGRAQAMVSMGSTGAAMASATLVLGLL